MKLCAFAILAGVLLIGSSYVKLVYGYGLLAVVLHFSKVSFKEFYPSVRSFRFFFIFTFLVQLFFTAGGSFKLVPDITQVTVATIMTLQFVLVIAYSALFTITTTPSDIARSLFVVAKPLKVFKVNLAEVAVSLLVAVRFIPLLFEESEKIVVAQKLRNGWDSETTWREKFSFFVKAESFIIPLFVRVIRYAEQISLTLHYRQNPVQIMALPSFIARDYVMFVVVIVLAVIAYAI